ncbi:MAG: septum formation initiator family protein [Pyrinomonadaceae bacterium]|nr:septum formation initiator family protein [Pyrinomonadaceae bacterium]
MRSKQATAEVRKSSPKKGRLIPRWAPYAAAIALTVSIMATLNFRTYMEYRRGHEEHIELGERIENLTDENLALQEEIHALKTDPKAIEQEARKYGLRPKKDRVSQPGKIDNADNSTSRHSPPIK